MPAQNWGGIGELPHPDDPRFLIILRKILSEHEQKLNRAIANDPANLPLLKFLNVAQASELPANCLTAGQLAVANNQLHLYNGSAWNPVGGGGGAAHKIALGWSSNTFSGNGAKALTDTDCTVEITTDASPAASQKVLAWFNVGNVNLSTIYTRLDISIVLGSKVNQLNNIAIYTADPAQYITACGAALFLSVTNGTYIVKVQYSVPGGANWSFSNPRLAVLYY